MPSPLRTVGLVLALSFLVACAGGSPGPETAGSPTIQGSDGGQTTGSMVGDSPDPEGLPGSPGATDEEAEVDVVDNAYEPRHVSITVGGEVSWSWEGDGQHSVTSVDGSFDSGVKAEGGFSQRFDEQGSYEYYCTVHSTPDGEGMNGVVVVAR